MVGGDYEGKTMTRPPPCEVGTDRVEVLGNEGGAKGLVVVYRN